jgi:hypothetical protein
MSGKKLMVTARILPDGTLFMIHGRDAWAFLELLNAGRAGCTPIDTPGPRWSAYVHALRHECSSASRPCMSSTRDRSPETMHAMC